MAQMSDSCPFCDIVAGRAHAELVHQWPRAVAFFPREPATVGHTLVVPREHVADIWSLEKDLGRIISDCVLETANAIRFALGPPGLNVINSAGKAATQTVGHLHVHLLPRYQGDRMGLVWPEVSSATTAKLRSGAGSLLHSTTR